MNDENGEGVKAKEGEQDDFAEVPLISQEILEGEFSETRDKFTLAETDDDDAEPIHEAEFVEEPPRVAAAEVQPGEADDRFAAFLANLPKDNDVTIIVKRRPDYGLKFRIPYPSGSPKFIRNIYWDGRSAEEIYAVLVSEEGGGRYGLQLQYGGGYKEAWDVVLDDPATPSSRELTLQGDKAKETEHERIPDTSHPVAPSTQKSAFAELKERLQEANEIKELLGVKEAEPSAAVAEAIPVKDQIALEMMKFAGNSDPELGSQVIKKILGISDSKDEKSWSDIAWYGVTHANEIAQVANVIGTFAVPLLGSLFGRQPPPPNTAMQPAGTIVRMPPQPAANPPAAGVVMPPVAPQPAGTVNDASEVEKKPPAATKPIPRVKW